MDAPNQNGQVAGHFSSLLKHWRKVRRLTQIDLAVEQLAAALLVGACARADALSRAHVQRALRAAAYLWVDDRLCDQRRAEYRPR